MRQRILASIAWLACTVLLASACASQPSDVAQELTEASPNLIAQAGAPQEVPACGDPEAAPHDVAGWPVGGSPEARIIPVIVSSSVSVGPGRFLFSITDRDYRVISAPDVAVSVDFYALDRDPSVVVSSTRAAYLDTQLGRGLYRSSVEFDCAGEWGAEVTARLTDGSTQTERMRFLVRARDTTPAIGEPAPRSDSPTATTVDELRRISTDPNPLPRSFERTIAEVVTAGQPSLVFFATPAFCQTGYCGPTVNLVKSVVVDYEGRVGFVNVEPFELRMTEAGLQPVLDQEGQLVPVQAVHDYGIPVEPYLFLVDAEGDVFAKFEGVVGADELRASIEDALAAST